MSYMSSNPYLLNLVPIFNVANSPTGATSASDLTTAVNALENVLNTNTNTLGITTIVGLNGLPVTFSADVDIEGSLTVNGYVFGPSDTGVNQIYGNSVIISATMSTISSVLVQSPSYFQNSVYVSSSVSAISFVTLSDQRVKNDIYPLRGALSTICELQGVHYTMGGLEQIGFLAQQVRSVVPEAVTQGADGLLGVDYSRIVPLLVEAVKEIAGFIKPA